VASNFFKHGLINTGVVECVYSIFENVQKNYSRKLRSSIQCEINSGSLMTKGNPINYNYLILDGTLFHQLLDNYEEDSLLTPNIKNKDFDEFKNQIIYAGKGKNDRKFTHLVTGKKINLKQLVLSKISAKFSKIASIWEKGHGITILHLFSETNQFEALSREFAIIKAIRLNNLTNIVNGTPYGAMKNKWNNTEVVNFGNMMLYYALSMAIRERPAILYKEDIQICNSTEGKRSMEDYEMQGILECFLEL
jgi:hypothetical protein